LDNIEKKKKKKKKQFKVQECKIYLTTMTNKKGSHTFTHSINPKTA